ncbi:LANO_0D05952g1_1 [Lachancea nothofagi CBS 11611]|uniref:LANO_0D05952g1_1 n=1 Tax=Lachancea nothofagi CBS 11611 TaxID=1266666 RepID=A0A1G4JHV8_9SACH|nr:LANO_0D05952g1_1 [Lachancea nothofagi CBS 11611]
MEVADLRSHFQKFKIDEKAGGSEKDLGNQDTVCECEDKLDIFERFVQDPCMNSWEGLDEEDGGDEEDEDDDDVPSQWEEDEYLGAVQEGVEGFGGRTAKSTTKPNVCTKCHKTRRWKTRGSTAQDPDEPVLRCSRTNSFMSQLSRQASRQSLPDASEPLQAGSSVEIGPTCTGSRSRSRSSFGASSAIPAHLYCLERFVSCELDSAAECFFKKDLPAPHNSITTSPTASVGSPGSPTLSRVLSSSSSTNTAKNSPEAHSQAPFSLSKRKSRVSSIELSLLNSLS